MDPSEATAEGIAASFHVSREVVFRRFLDRDLISQRAYNEAAARWAEQRQSGGAGGNYYWTKLAYLGRDYVALALSQYRQNRIDERKLADYLDMKPKNLAGIEDYFARAGAYVCLRHLATHNAENYYPRRFPTLWRNFDTIVAAGNLVSTREAYRELLDGPSAECRQWAESNQSLFSTPNAAEGAFVARIYGVRHFH